MVQLSPFARNSFLGFGSLLLILCILFAPVAAEEATSILRLNANSSSPTTGELYQPLYFDVEVDPLAYQNPFDPNDIEILGVFKSPSGKQLVVPGFWMQPFEDQCQLPCQVEDLQPVGEPVWQVRFTPQEVGEWAYALEVHNGVKVLTVENGDFDVVASERRGFIRVSNNGRYFQYDNGESYFPIGHNLKWSWEGGGGLYAYQNWLRDLSESGGNYARLYIDVPWFIGLEWSAPVGDYRASQRGAARLDSILNMAENYGVALQLVLLWHQALKIYNGPPVLIPDTFERPDMSADWENNPYNIIYGGPLGSPSLFFSTEQAQTLFRQRLRYIVARWGYSPQIFAWELIDEADQTSGYDPQTVTSWLTNTGSFLKQIDQQGHLITAGSREFDITIASNPLLDFTEAQFYQHRPIETVIDQVTGTVNIIHQNLQTNSVPNLLTAYSLNPWFEPTADDPDGIHFQTTLWASILAGAAGGASGDWWDTYIIPQQLQHYYSALAAFVSGVDWANLNLETAEAGLITDDYGVYTPVRLDNFNRTFSAPPLSNVVTHSITADGVSPSTESLPSYLYGQVYNNQLSQAQLYRVVLPVSSYLEIRINRVSPQGGARLVATIDGQTALSIDLSAGSQNVAAQIPLPSGEHEITLDNLGEDWMEIAYLEIGQLAAPARVLTLRDATAGIALAWVQHRDYTWEKVTENVSRVAFSFQYRLDHMPSGVYAVEIWDPIKGGVIGNDSVRVDEDSILWIDLPPLDSEVALRAFRVGELPAISPTATATSPAIVTEALLSTPTPSITVSAPLLVQTNTPRPTSTITSEN